MHSLRFPPPWICLPRQRARRAKSWPEATGNGMFCTLPMAAVIVEGVPMHLLLHRWSHVAAWISTGIGIYSFLWMVALYRSLALRPVLVSADHVVLQVGFLWRAEFRPDRVPGGAAIFRRGSRMPFAGGDQCAAMDRRAARAGRGAGAFRAAKAGDADCARGGRYRGVWGSIRLMPVAGRCVIQ